MQIREMGASPQMGEIYAQFFIYTLCPEKVTPRHHTIKILNLN